ncbi:MULTISPECIES: hypothetical protein [Citrobacter]|uniref:hypothetical protein n=1 Tax=Citrobacter TaxID=544 RepID=UPI000EF228A2|nr:hypothetical protein [Citrobacter pasteurii]AYL64149.1 hypothetical protein CUC49_22295 [Citrobacter pasteurii]
MSSRTHRQLVSVEVMWPAQALPLPLQQLVEALNQGETPDQIIIRMNQRGLLAWREDASAQDTHDIFQVRLDNQHEARFLCRYAAAALMPLSR